MKILYRFLFIFFILFHTSVAKLEIQSNILAYIYPITNIGIQYEFDNKEAIELFAWRAKKGSYDDNFQVGKYGLIFKSPLLNFRGFEVSKGMSAYHVASKEFFENGSTKQRNGYGISIHLEAKKYLKENITMTLSTSLGHQSNVAAMNVLLNQTIGVEFGYIIKDPLFLLNKWRK